MLYEVTLWAPSQYEPCHDAKTRFICGSMREAELYAKSKLTPAYESYYSARRARLPYVTAIAVIRFCPMSGGREYRPCSGRRATFETPIYIVPSVGDLGYTP